MRLKEALDIKHDEVVSLVGGGGKTSIMFRLAQELVYGGETVITTTTTKILEPSASETPLLILEKDESAILSALTTKLMHYRHITVVTEKLPSGRLVGISPELVDKISIMKLADYIIVEADGAACRPLKAPNATEPVFPANTSLVVAVVGVDAIGCPLTEKDVFRSEIASRLLGLPLGATVTADSVALLITHHQGIIKGAPHGARIVPFINKVDLDGGLARGRDLAKRILAKSHPRIRRVVLGQAKSDEPAVEVEELEQI